MRPNFTKLVFLTTLLFYLLPLSANRITVLTSFNDGPGSLRLTIGSAQPGDTIDFADRLNDATILLESEIIVNKSITIDGTSAANLAISGNNANRIFNIMGEGNEVNLNSLQLINGLSDTRGGAILLTAASLNISNSTLTDNSSIGFNADDGGGAIANDGGTLTVSDSELSNNSALGASGSGGGIINLNGGLLTVQNTVFAGNSANRAGGGIEDVSGSETTATITNTTFDGNATGSAPGNGGAVHITGPSNMDFIGGSVLNNTAAAEGGGLWNGSGMMNISGVMIEGNTASGPAANQGGGGVFNAGGIINILDSTIITNNVADGTAGSGGGILNDEGSTLTVTDSRLTGNTSVRAGGAIEDVSGNSTFVTLTGVIMDQNVTGGSPGNGGAVHITGPGFMTVVGGRVTNNVASLEGGGLWNGSGMMTISSVFISGNEAQGNDADTGGGGVFNNGGTLTIMDETIISDNRATGTSGSGGGILNIEGSTLTVSNTTISSNTSNRAGGGIEDVSGSETTATITNVTFDGNSTGSAPGNGGAVHITGPSNMDISGGSVTNNMASAEGGGLWNGTGLMTISGVLIDGNTASGPESNQGGGGVFNAGGSIIIQDSTIITNNVADGTAGSGGGILNDAGGALTVTDSRLSGNTSVRAGGGIEDVSGAGSAFTVTDVIFTDNTTGGSPGNGGAIHLSGDGDLSISGGLVSGNTATLEGGGLWNNLGTMTVSGVTITNNEAQGNDADTGGGGLFNNGGTMLVNDGTVIDGNRAIGTSGSGGGILNIEGSTLTVSNTIITNNTSNRAGGGIEDVSGSETTATITDVTFGGNSTGSAPGNGGAVHITGPSNMDISGGSVTNNTAAAEGGGLWNGTGLMTITGVLIDGNTASGPESNQGGGGVFNAGGGIIIQDSTIITNNVADGTAGSGGGILNDAGGALTVTDTRLSGNTSVRAGGGIEDVSGAGSAFTVTDVIFTDNITGGSPGNGGAIHLSGDGDLTISGGLVSGNTATLEGGGLWNNLGTMTVSGVTITNNEAQGNDADTGGGGLFNNGGTMVVNDGTVIDGNRATGTSGSGGGILNVDGSILMVSNTTISNNTSNRAGGGIEDVSGSETTATITNVTFDGNSTGSAPGNGGAVHITGPSNMDISGGSVTNNTAAAEGGGLWNGAGLMTISNVTIDGNIAMGDDPTQGGGGVFNNGGTLQITSSTISNNASTNTGSGGGINNAEGSSLMISTTTISGNTSTAAGAGIANFSALTLMNSTVAFNIAATDGGGLLQFEGADSTQITGTILAENMANGTGADLFGMGMFTSAGFNLVGIDDAGTFSALSTDLVGTINEPIVPMLMPLADNGGPTQTHALDCPSPAIDMGNPDDSSLDQRGESVFMDVRDIGAFERQAICEVSNQNFVELLGAKVYPNPVAGSSVTVFLPPRFVTGQVQIVDMGAGRLIAEHPLTAGNNNVHTDYLPNGMYVLRILSGSQQTRERIIVSR